MNFLDICAKARNSDNELLIKSANVCFRNLLDPYAAEWSYNTNEERFEIVELLDALLQVNEPLVVLCTEYKNHFRLNDRNDIADACTDALAKLLCKCVRAS